MTNVEETAIAIADLVSPPGETLLEVLEERGMTQKELAKRTGRPIKTINEIVRGKGAITAETALQLEHVLGIKAGFWLTREQHYREALARMVEGERLRYQTGWLDKMPLQKMIKLGWIAKQSHPLEQLREVLMFFGIASPDQWEDLWGTTTVEFRRSTKAQIDEYALSAWLQQGERQAYEIVCQPYDEHVFRQTITLLRALSTARPADYMAAIVQQCARAGVAVVYVPEVPGMGVFGATHWLTATKAVIQLSLRQKDDGHFWFTLFHEAGHILLHGKKDFFIEDDQMETTKEREANTFASNQLISSTDWQRFIGSHSRMSKKVIITFAHEVGVAPGIIVGRLQHEGKIPHTDGNGLKRQIFFPVNSEEM